MQKLIYPLFIFYLASIIGAFPSCSFSSMCGDGFCCKFTKGCYCSHYECNDFCTPGDLISGLMRNQNITKKKAMKEEFVQKNVKTENLNSTISNLDSSEKSELQESFPLLSKLVSLDSTSKTSNEILYPPVQRRFSWISRPLEKSRLEMEFEKSHNLTMNSNEENDKTFNKSGDEVNEELRKGRRFYSKKRASAKQKVKPIIFERNHKLAYTPKALRYNGRYMKSHAKRSNRTKFINDLFQASNKKVSTLKNLFHSNSMIALKNKLISKGNFNQRRFKLNKKFHLGRK